MILKGDARLAFVRVNISQGRFRLVPARAPLVGCIELEQVIMVRDGPEASATVTEGANVVGWAVSRQAT